MAAFLLLYFVRPLLPHGAKASSVFAAHSMIEFCWYVSILAVLLAIYGLYRFLRERREKATLLLLFFALGVSNLLVYLLWPSITPDHIWASRRWISVCIPFLLILAGYGLSKIAFPKCKWVACAARSALCLAVSGYLIYQSAPFLFARTLHSIADQYEAAAADMEEGEVYFTHSKELASYLRFVYGQTVYLMQYGQDPQPVEDYLQQNGPLRYVGAHPYAFLNPFHCEVTQQSRHTISGLYLEQTVSSYPRKLVTMKYPASAYTISAPSAPISQVALPLSLFSSQNNVSEDASCLRSDGTERFLLSGPYLDLDAGEYTAEITFRLFGGSGHIAQVDYAAGGAIHGETLLVEEDFAPDGTYTLLLPIRLNQSMADFELRVVSFSGVTLEISGITLEKNS